MLRKFISSGLCAVALLGLAGPARADVVNDWNNVLLQAIRADKTSPPKASRAIALMNVAVFDAVNGIVGGYSPYHVTSAAPAGASPEAAAVAAAHKALVALFPAQAATFDAAQVASLSAIPDGAGKTLGIAWGESVAGQILDLRAHDHSGDVVTANLPLGARWWERTPPALADPLLPNWPTVTPWAISSAAQLRPDPPPVLASADYTAAFEEVRLLGRVDSPLRTSEQTQIALFWADGGGTATPPGHWVVIAQGVSSSQHLTLIQNARLFALVGMAVADASLVAWDAKYHYLDWRPITGIRNADTDGNPNTPQDTTWSPLIATPPFPSYISGHSTFSSAAARILALFLGTDSFSFTTTSDGLPGVQRSFTSFSQAAAEAGQSRIYGGIHWQYDNQAGLAAGRAVAEQIFYDVLTPVAAVTPCVESSTALCIGNHRFKVEAIWRYANVTGNVTGVGHTLQGTSDSGQFWFFDADNVELTVKVLDGCSINDHFWVFASGLTDVEVVLRVTDTQTGRTRTYFNPLKRAYKPVQDTSAFSCP
jgi:membrane-associated phospholipid phosphatase